jgi:hypothetical protein
MRSRPVLLELYSDPYILVRQCVAERLLVVTRRPTQYPSLEEMSLTFERIAPTIAHIPRSEWRVIIDVRFAPARNDPAFEQAFGERRKLFSASFAQVGLMVRTAAGRLQIARYAKHDGTRIELFSNAGEASRGFGVYLDEELLRLPEG